MQNTEAANFTITSDSFLNGQTLPNKQVYNQFGCTGGNLSPQLKWQGAPAGVKSYAIIAHDPDAPRPTGWYHWIVLNIPASTASFKEGQAISAPMVEIKNDFGIKDYGGACPPKGHGTHHYNFTIYALNVEKLDVPQDGKPDIIEKMVKQKAIASATITALYSRN